MFVFQNDKQEIPVERLNVAKLVKKAVEEDVESSSETTVSTELMTATLSCNLDIINDLSAAEIFVINADGLLKHLDGEEAVTENDHTVTLLNEL